MDNIRYETNEELVDGIIQKRIDSAIKEKEKASEYSKNGAYFYFDGYRQALEDLKELRRKLYEMNQDK